MDQTPQGRPAKREVNQNMVIAIIGAVATILAAVIPYLTNFFNPQPAATSTPTATVALVTDTVMPTFTFTPELGDTETPTPALPTETPTTPVGIYDVYLAQDRAGDHPTTTFGTEQTVFVFFSLNDPSGQNSVEVVWIAVDAQGRKPNVELGREEGTVTKPKYSFEITLSPWPVGKFKAELYLNGSLATTQEFEIK